MKIKVAKSAGLCFGVKRALNIALQAAGSGNEVYMLGDIVHNEIVVDELKRAGIKKIDRLGRGQGKVLLIRAHGAQEKTVESARRAGYEIIDATCPMVKEIHAIAKKLEDDNRAIIIIGDKKHDEVRGIVGQLKRRPIIISGRSDISSRSLKNIIRAGVIVQSTQDEEKVFKMVDLLKKYIKNLAFKNTICDPTRTKQKEAKELPLGNDVVIIVGSKNSANTKRLYQIARSINRRTHWVNSPGQIRAGWFKAGDSIGITGGASTPESSIKKVVRRTRFLDRLNFP